jgi:metal-dependent HD superfamily phosphatase/phosphodiesterase
MKSPKELSIDTKLTDLVGSLGLSGKAFAGLKILLASDELQAIQEYANTVSIIRLGYNDHGPVHMRTVTYTAALMLDLLRQRGIKTTLETNECGDFEDSLFAVIFGSFLHDIGMGMGRQNHELHSTIMALPIIDNILAEVYGNNWNKRAMIRALALEGIAGHMGTIGISSLESGIIQIADGCDMTKGRARIPFSLHGAPRAGHIHQYSANSIEKVYITAGNERPIRIDVNMSSEVGLFQVEEVLLQKIANSTAKQHIELYAQVDDKPTKRYL